MFWIGFGLSEAVVGAMAVLSYLNGWLFGYQLLPSQKLLRGTPFSTHGACWGDLLLISPALGVIAKYGPRWSFKLWPMIAGFGLAIGMSALYVADSTAHPTWAADAGRPTPAGIVHFFYQAGIFWVLFMFFFQTLNVSRWDAGLVSVLLALHLLISVVQPTYVAGKSLADPIMLLTVAGAWTVIAFGFLYQQKLL